MKAKEYLGQLRKIDSVIHNRMEQLSDLEADISRVEKSNCCQAGTQLFCSDSRIITDLKKLLTRDIARMHSMRYKITREIERIPDERYRKILTLRYVEGKRLMDVAEEMFYDYDWVRKLHGRALMEFERRCLKKSTQKHTDAG